MTVLTDSRGPRVHAPVVVASRARRWAAGAVARPAPTAVVAALVASGAAAVAGAALVAALQLAGGAPVAVPAGVPDPGALTSWALRGARLAVDLAAVATAGALVVGTLLLPAGTGEAGVLERVRRAAHAAALAWTTLLVAAVALTVADGQGVPVTALDPTATRWLVAEPVLGLLLAAAAAAALTQGTGRGRTLAPWLLAPAALAAVAPTVVSGHAGTSGAADLAVPALLVHVVAAVAWTGGLAGTLVLLHDRPRALAAAVPRLSALAAGCVAVLLASGLATALALLDPVAAWRSGYAAVLAAKSAVLVLALLAGAAHRRATLPRLRAGDRRAFVRLAGAEVLLLGVATGLAAALAQTPAPAADPAAGHAAAAAALPALDGPAALWRLVAPARPDVGVTVVLGLVLLGYLRGRAVLATRGEGWPAVRTAAFAAGLAVAWLDLCAGVASYAPVVLSAQVAQVLVALLVVPTLLVLGRPGLLLARVRGASEETARGTGAVPPWATGPLPGAGVVCGLLVALHRTPLAAWAAGAPQVQLLLVAAAVAAGLLLAAAVLPAAVSAGHRTAAQARAAAVAAVAAVLGALAWQLLRGDRLVTGGWVLERRPAWLDAPADQQVAGVVVAVTAALVLAASARVLRAG